MTLINTSKQQETKPKQKPKQEIRDLSLLQMSKKDTRFLKNENVRKVTFSNYKNDYIFNEKSKEYNQNYHRLLRDNFDLFVNHYRLFSIAIKHLSNGNNIISAVCELTVIELNNKHPNIYNELFDLYSLYLTERSKKDTKRIMNDSMSNVLYYIIDKFLLYMFSVDNIFINIGGTFKTMKHNEKLGSSSVIMYNGIDFKNLSQYDYDALYDLSDQLSYESNFYEYKDGIYKNKINPLIHGIDNDVYNQYAGYMQRYVDAVNKLQKTKFVIDYDCVDFYRYLVDNDVYINDKLNFKYYDVMKACETREASEVKKLNSQKTIHYVNLNSLKKYKDISFVNSYELTRSGRFYNTSLINPQKNRIFKLLYRFEQSKKFGQGGLFNFMVSLALSYGLKESFDTILDNPEMDEVKKSALRLVNHFKNKRYVEVVKIIKCVKDPILFMLYSLEYVKLKEFSENNNPEDFESNVPIYIDGTANSYQHISMFMNNDEMKKLCNVHFDDKINDIYTYIKDGLIKSIITNTENAHATKVNEREWDFIQFCSSVIYTRDFVKKLCMTYLFTSKTLRFNYMTLLFDEFSHYANSKYYSAVKNKLNYINIIKLQSFMINKFFANDDLFSKLTSIKINIQKSLSNKNPYDVFLYVNQLGFPIIRTSRVLNKKTMNIYNRSDILYKRYDCLNKKQLAQLKKTGKKLTSFMFTDFIHNLDSMNLVYTVEEFNDDLITIHDEFATHACSINELKRSLNLGFLKVHEHSQLDRYLHQMFYVNDLISVTKRKNELVINNSNEFKNKISKQERNMILENDYMFC